MLSHLAISTYIDKSGDFNLNDSVLLGYTADVDFAFGPSARANRFALNRSRLVQRAGQRECEFIGP